MTAFNMDAFLLQKRRRTLLIGEGFEARCTSWVARLPQIPLFIKSVVFKNMPVRESRLDELLEEIKPRTTGEIIVLDYERYNPVTTEFAIEALWKEISQSSQEIVIDLSVMSKLLIMMILYAGREFHGAVRCIYSEPQEFSPSREEYEKSKLGMSFALPLPTFGVHDVVRTAMLSSSVMQSSPAVVVAFTSFNEQLVRALLSSVSPNHLFLVSSVPPHLCWREKATQDIHEDVLREYQEDNPKDEKGHLINRVSTLHHGETFDLLADIYKRYCYTHRIILSPTGSKMQAVACGLFKICCPEVNVEYPTPESIFIQGFSSDKIREIHEFSMEGFVDNLKALAENEGLNG